MGAGDGVGDFGHEFRVEAVPGVGVEDVVVDGRLLQLGDLFPRRLGGELGDERRPEVAVVVGAELEPAAHE